MTPITEPADGPSPPKKLSVELTGILKMSQSPSKRREMDVMKL